jgi:hypothetical protein
MNIKYRNDELALHLKTEKKGLISKSSKKTEISA